MSPTAPIHFRRGVFQDATDDYNDRRHELAGAIDTLVGVLNGAGGSAGSDDPGSAFSAIYDTAKDQALEGATIVINATGNMHDLLQQSAFNYKHANIVDPAKEQSDLAVPDWMSALYYVPTPPSSFGGPTKDPGWWESLKSYVGGKIWPNGDADKLKEVGSAWKTASETFTAVADAMGPTNDILANETVPEAAQIQACSGSLVEAVRQMAGNMLAIGNAATDYGDAIEDAHDKLNDQVKTLVEVALAAVAAGVVVAFFTLGVGAAVGGGGGAAAMTAAAVRALTILEALAGAAAGLGVVTPTLVADTAVKMNGIQGLLEAQPIAAAYSAVDAQGGGAYDVAGRRVTLRKSTKEQVQQDTRDKGLVTQDGDFIDPNTGAVVPKNGPYDYGHSPGYEWWRTREIARREGWTREELIEYENNPKHYQIEDPSTNRSHRYEVPRK